MAGKTRKGTGNTREWFLEKWSEKYVEMACVAGNEVANATRAARDVIELSSDLDRLLEGERERAVKAVEKPQRLLEGTGS